jgi:TPR repeat protein
MNKLIVTAAALSVSAMFATPAAAQGAESHQPFSLVPDPGNARSYAQDCDFRPFDCALNLIERRRTREALPLLEQSAERGSLVAMRAIGLIYLRGEGDTAQNLPQAVRWFQAAARRGDAESMYTLGVMYRRGYAVGANQAEAITWLQRAADAGYTRASAVLSAMN